MEVSKKERRSSIWLRREKQRQREKERIERYRIRNKDKMTKKGNGELGRLLGNC